MLEGKALEQARDSLQERVDVMSLADRRKGEHAGPAVDAGSEPGSDGAGDGATRILIVDDNPDIIESTSLILELAGYAVRSALSGQAALDLAPAFRPSIVLLDIGMPGLDGYAVARRFRAEPLLRDTVLIAVTGYGTAADRARAMSAGFDRHLVKPVDPAVLEQTLAEVGALRRR
ncbi:MAG: response regulator [Steroidobacteraceae bacterium]